MVGAKNFRTAAPTAASAFAAAFILAAVFGTGYLRAETVATTEVTALVNAVRSSSDTEATVYTLSEAKLTFSSRGANETKGQVTIDFKAGDAVVLDLRKAWMKARVDAIRLTLGKTRLSWGEGVLFNAGNVIFGSTAVDLSAEDVRDDNAWLAAATFPLGDFSFIEAVALPPDPPLAAILAKSVYPASTAPISFGGWENCSAGGRIYTKLGEVKAEAGYFWAGESSSHPIAAHKPYLSFQGNLLADWHLSTSARVVPPSGTASDPAVKDWTVSAGLYHQWSVPSSWGEGAGDASLGTLAFRLEGMLRPYESWDPRKIAASAVNPAAFLSGGTSLDSPYALLVYPELSWKTNTVYAFLRSLVSPIDLSARTALAVQWAPLQGFKIIGSVTVQSGEDGDLFGWSRAGSWQAALGTRLSF